MSDSISELENGAKSPDASGSSDPASSLRAAALLTLKSKRRKPTIDTSGNPGPSQRPPPTDTSLQLDYGQEDIGSSPTDVAMVPVPLKASHPDLEDAGQTREEGEISDSEDALSKPVPKSELDTPTVVKVESPTHNLLDRIRDPPQPASVSLGEHFIDADHVRPGLSLNQDQYDTAKDIVLDLLGWGVPPEFLVDCNLSREIVYYVFSELNLRLPHNLDIGGLVPYTPAHVALYSRPLSAMPHPARPDSSSSRPFHGHPSLPPKPLAGLNAASSASPPHPPSPSSAPSPTNQHSTNGSLHDMERQRRQELLARKAVQASRKIKPPSDASSTASSSYRPEDPSGVQDQDVDMTPAIATEAVDDFLKTIGEKSVTPEASMPAEWTDTMDIDEIPGLGGSTMSFRSTGSFYSAHPEGHSQLSNYTDQVVVSPAESSFNAPSPPSQSQTDPAPTSGESGSTTFGLEPASYDEVSSHQALQRRGSKRPTAADFVDFDAGSRNGYTNGSIPTLRRKTASFASVSGHRKLVIDLSDSEGEGGEDYVMHDSAESDRWEGGSGYSSPAPGRYSATPISAGVGGWATPPGTMTPAALMEKEQEIRKMRELIAQREKSRKQKTMSRTTTAPSVREDDRDAVSNGSAFQFHSDGHHTSPPENSTITEPLADKRALTDSVMAGSASTSASATPPNIDSKMADQSGAPIAISSGSQGSISDDTSPPKTRRKSSNIAGPTAPRRHQQL
ncbi:hypothetical protein C8R43DRAFT_1011618 [Mycena crocata]|nr:hypothetical protein C8R43DRAFT_1011618 [Mycena crocata]